MINSRHLRVIADRQAGYFTAQQAQDSGYASQLQTYHVRARDWVKIDRGLFRLPGYPNTHECEFIRWTFWAKRRLPGELAVISHESALYYYNLSDVEPTAVHLSVPSMRRVLCPSGCVIHCETLTPKTYEAQRGFCITTVHQTIAAMQSELIYHGRWFATLEKAHRLGLLSEEQAHRLFGESAFTSSLSSNRTHRMNVHEMSVSSPGSAGQEQRSRELNTVAPTMGAVRGRHAEWRVPNRTFTLVEMLIVIAIICTLAALLQPALLSALGQARSSACQSNLRQLGICTSNYLGDNYDWIPYAGLSPTCWRDPLYGWVAQYAGPGALGKPSYVNTTQPYSDIYPSTETFLTCPVNPRPWNTQRGIRCRWANGNYGLNYKIAATYMNNVWWSRSVKIGTISDKPYAKMFAADLSDDGNYYGGNGSSHGWAIGISNPERMDGRHPGETADVLFMDMHAGSEISPVPSSDTTFWLP